MNPVEGCDKCRVDEAGMEHCVHCNGTWLNPETGVCVPECPAATHVRGPHNDMDVLECVALNETETPEEACMNAFNAVYNASMDSCECDADSQLVSYEMFVNFM